MNDIHYNLLRTVAKYEVVQLFYESLKAELLHNFVE
nr:MAG TPA: hypothetical protein [Caudoviricetes sp.]